MCIFSLTLKPEFSQNIVDCFMEKFYTVESLNCFQKKEEGEEKKYSKLTFFSLDGASFLLILRKDYCLLLSKNHLLCLLFPVILSKFIEECCRFFNTILRNSLHEFQVLFL